MIPITTIHADDKTVTIKLMDDSWLINQCAGAHPFKPQPGIVTDFLNSVASVNIVRSVSVR